MLNYLDRMIFATMNMSMMADVTSIGTDGQSGSMNPWSALKQLVCVGSFLLLVLAMRPRNIQDTPRTV